LPDIFAARLPPRRVNTNLYGRCDTNGQDQRKDIGVSGTQTALSAKRRQAISSRAGDFSHSLLRVALLTTAAAVVSISSANAQFWSQGFSDDDDAIYEPAPIYREAPSPYVEPRHTRTTRRNAARLPKPAKVSRKPQGPLVIAISIQNQSLKIYDANGFFAETRVSTGMKGHSTPMGIFSVIQKHKWHRSNIYSDAPMPYMQRITWSGIAMHAGVLPGYPASHGCIRMPMSFATQMWNWTRMGARVVITPGELSPAPFSHPLLITQKPAPTPPVATAEPKQPDPAAPAPTAAADATKADATPGTAPVASELRPSIAPQTSPPAGQTTGMAKPDKPTQVADASNVLTAAAATTLTDSTPGKSAAPSTDAAAKPAEAPAVTAPRRTGPIAIFVSRKDGKLYVRQNFEPLFDVDVSIAPSDRPLGTHIFTAEEDKSQPGTFRWSAMTLPVSTSVKHKLSARSKQGRASDVAETGAALEPDSAAEALDRLTIPKDAMTRIAEALTTGSSLIVSDQGVASGETGQGTDFIVPLR
jgi:lipoprotein-anchoring transpeptidase ErfK/SrfK